MPIVDRNVGANVGFSQDRLTASRILPDPNAPGRAYAWSYRGPACRRGRQVKGFVAPEFRFEERHWYARGDTDRSGDQAQFFVHRQQSLDN
jgi:hypothetical protein